MKLFEKLGRFFKDSHSNRTGHDAMAYPVVYSEEALEAIEKHINTYFGKIDFAMHEIVSPDIHVDINVIPPTPQRNYYTLTTMGMGAYAMATPGEYSHFNRAELVITLPPNWDVKGTDEVWYWPLRWLKILARFPLENNTWLCYGHTIESKEPFAKNTNLSAIALADAGITFGDAAVCCNMPDGSNVHFYHAYPIYKDEMDFKLKAGFNALMERLPPNFTVDIARKSVISPTQK